MAANMNVYELELRICLTRIGFNDRQCGAIVAECFGSIADLGEMLLKDVSNVCATISKLAANRGGVRIGYALVRRLINTLSSGSRITIAAIRVPTRRIRTFKFARIPPTTWIWRILGLPRWPRGHDLTLYPF